MSESSVKTVSPAEKTEPIEMRFGADSRGHRSHALDGKAHWHCGDAFPIEGVLVATYLLSVEALPHCRCGVANKNRIV